MNKKRIVTLPDLLHNLKSGILIIDMNSEIQCSRSSTECEQLLLLQYPDRALDFQEVFHALRKSDALTLKALLRSCTVLNSIDEVFCRTRNGRWLLFRTFPLPRDRGAYPKLLVSVSNAYLSNGKFEEKLLKKKYDLINNALCPASFEIDIPSKTLTFSDIFLSHYACGQQTISPVPGPLLQGCILDKDSIKAYCSMYEDIYAGKSDGKVNVKLFSTLIDAYLPVTIVWKSVFDDRGKAVKTICVVEPIYDQLYDTETKKILSLQAKLELQEAYFRSFTENLFELRRYRHDQRNNIIALHSLIKNGDTSSALNYLSKMEDALKDDDSIVNTGNLVFDALLSDKLRKARDMGVTIKQTIGLPLELPIDLMDVCIAAGCCLDNAVEACGKVLDAGNDAFIDYRNALIFKLRNSALPATHIDGRLPNTTKADKQNHGIGLQNVQRIVSKYNGQLICTNDDATFTTAFTLFVP